MNNYISVWWVKKPMYSRNLNTFSNLYLCNSNMMTPCWPTMSFVAPPPLKYHDYYCWEHHHHHWWNIINGRNALLPRRCYHLFDQRHLLTRLLASSSWSLPSSPLAPPISVQCPIPVCAKTLLWRIYTGEKSPHVYTLSISTDKNQSTIRGALYIPTYEYNYKVTTGCDTIL